MVDQRIARDVLAYGDFVDNAGVISDSVATVKEGPTDDARSFYAYGEFTSSIENIEKESVDKAQSVCNDVLDYGKFSCAETPLPAVEQKATVEPAVTQSPVLDAVPDTEPPEPVIAKISEISVQRHKMRPASPDPSKTGAHDPKRIRAAFPIGAKLTACVTSMLLCSLGLLAAAIWFFMRVDARRTAEKHNADINRRVALTVETALSSIKNNVSMLFYGPDQPNPETVSSFFEEHPDIAAILSDGYGAGEHEEQPFIHEQFFLNHGIDASLASARLDQMDLKNREPRAEPVLLNASPFFERLPVLATRFPTDRGWIAVFFSSERLAENFGGSENVSMLFNSRGDVLVHVDQNAIRQESNFSDFFAMPVLGEFADSGETSFQTRCPNMSGDAYIVAIRRLNTVGNGLFVLTAIPEAVVFENINAITRLNLYLSLAACLIAIILMRFFSKTISVPLKLLKSAVQAMEDGSYNMMDSSRHDELGVLAESVNGMIRTLANVESFANKKIARRIWKGQIGVEGTRKEATVFFSSLCSFTENEDNPEETVALFNDYLERISLCVTRTGGVVDRCVGATVMAHWGAADSSGDVAGGAGQNAVNAVCAALMMRAVMRSLNDSLNETGGKPLVRASFGLNSGSVTAAQIGGSDRLEYAVMGDTVTLANRARDFCEAFGAEIIITGNTRNLIKDSFIIEDLPPIIDKRGEIRLFTVVNVRKIEILERIFSDIEQMPKANLYTSRLCLGPGAPQNMAELRKMLRLSAPDMSKATNEEKKKYAIQTGG